MDWLTQRSYIQAKVVVVRVTFSTWGISQPNFQHGGEDCGVLRISSKKWHDYPCKARFGYICEINGKYNLKDKKAV